MWQNELIEAITCFVFKEDPLDTATAYDIAFIPGGTDPELGEHAASLYRMGAVTTLLPSGKYSIKNGRFDGVKSKKHLYAKAYPTEWAFLKDVLMQNGVPECAILKEDMSTYTQENADFSRRVLDAQGIAVKRAVLCCKPHHARRAWMYYQMAFPEAHIDVSPCVYNRGGVRIDRHTWHTTPEGIERVLGELQRCGTQFTERFKDVLTTIETRRVTMTQGPTVEATHTAAAATYTIRTATEADTAAYLKMLVALDAQTSFMLFEPGERPLAEERLKKWLTPAESDGLRLVVETDGAIVGFLSGGRGAQRRIRHSVYIVVGLLDGHRGRGLGTRLFEALDTWAAAHGIVRQELTVMVHNAAGIALYEKMGYRREGVKRKAVLIDGVYWDEYYMGKVMD